MANRGLRRPQTLQSRALLLVGWVDAVELAQQSRPFEPGRIIAAASEAKPGIVTGSADDLAADRVEVSTRLLEGELHRASPLHAIRRDKGRGDAGPDDQQAVIAQDHDMAITEIGEEARAFLGASRRPLVVVIGDLADHLQCMLVERQQPVFLHRYGAAG